MYQQHDANYFILHISSLSEYINGEQSLIRSHFIYDKTKDISKDSCDAFSKSKYRHRSRPGKCCDSIAFYTFKLKSKKIPDSVAYAEDLLQFDSHEFLASYFGEKNVRKDLVLFF